MAEYSNNKILTELLKAVSDTTRRSLLTRLCQQGSCRVTDLAEYYEKGPQEYIAHQWTTLLRYIEVDFPALVPVVQEACNLKTIKALFPYTSHDKLCFSRCTGYPYTDDCPNIIPFYEETGIYQVLSPK